MGIEVIKGYFRILVRTYLGLFYIGDRRRSFYFKFYFKGEI